MANQERELTPEEQKIEDAANRKLADKLAQMSVWNRLARTRKSGAAVVLATAVIAGGLGLDQGTKGGTESGEQNERERLFAAGVLLPELREKLTGGEHLVVNVANWTPQRLRELGIEVPNLPLEFPEEDGNPETTNSSHKWFAVAPEGLYLPRKEEDKVSSLASAVRTANTAARNIDSRLGFAEATYSEFIEAEIANLRENGQSLLQDGYVATSHRIEVDGVNTGFAIGRATPEDPISIITFDATSDAPLPANISAGGIIVAR